MSQRFRKQNKVLNHLLAAHLLILSSVVSGVHTLLNPIISAIRFDGGGPKMPVGPCALHNRHNALHCIALHYINGYLRWPK